MSIPLDRHYHYLESLCSDDILIYRWYPHGSKKLEDLSVINDARFPKTRQEALLTNSMICHDQEPLNFNYYTPEIRLDNASNWAATVKFPYVKFGYWRSEKFTRLAADSHFRIAITYFLNFNDHTLLCHSEKNSDQLAIYEENGFVGVYYWAHGLIARDWYRYALHDLTLIPDFDNITHDFLIYQRAWSGTREYRLKLSELLIDNNLVDHCKIKFNQWDNQTHYTNHSFVNESLSVTRSDIEDYIPANSASSDSSADYDSKDYASAGIEVVLETLFDDSRLHLTEKALRPIACGRPFILVGTPGSLEYLRNYGFKTFTGLIDESYDTISDPLLRLQAIVKELKRISMLSTNDKRVLWQELYKIAAYNKTRFFSQEFHNDIVNEFVNNVKIGAEKCSQTMSGKWWKLANDPDIVGDNVVIDDCSDWANEWILQNSKINQATDFSITPSHPSAGDSSLY